MGEGRGVHKVRKKYARSANHAPSATLINVFFFGPLFFMLFCTESAQDGHSVHPSELHGNIEGGLGKR